MKYQNIIILTAMGFFFLACTKESVKEEPVLQVKKSFLDKVKTIKTEYSNLDQELTLTGKVECDPEKTVNYSSFINGIIDRTYFSLGDKVQKGQLMLDIRSTELSALQSEKITLETELKIAEREMRTAQSMYNDGMISERDLFEAEGKLRQSQSALKKIKTDISVYGVQKSDGTFSVKAPITGYVISKNAASGSTVSEGSEPLFTIADLSTIWILVNVYAGNLQFVHEGMDVEITSLSYPGEIFEAKINSIPQIFDSEEKVLKARIIMPNHNLKFKPEMSVLVKLKNNNETKCIAIPTEALIFDNNRYYVVIEESSGKYIYKQVYLQGHNSTSSYISSGLNGGENIVVKNQLLIYTGLKGN